MCVCVCVCVCVCPYLPVPLALETVVRYSLDFEYKGIGMLICLKMIRTIYQL